MNLVYTCTHLCVHVCVCVCVCVCPMHAHPARGVAYNNHTKIVKWKHMKKNLTRYGRDD